MNHAGKTTLALANSLSAVVVSVVSAAHAPEGF